MSLIDEQRNSDKGPVEIHTESRFRYLVGYLTKCKYFRQNVLLVVRPS